MPKKKRNKKKRTTQKWSRSIDLHGYRVEEALAELDRFLNRCIMDDEVYKLEIIHGLGTGKLKKAVFKYLETIRAIVGFYPDPLNPGVTWVDL